MSYCFTSTFFFFCFKIGIKVNIVAVVDYQVEEPLPEADSSAVLPEEVPVPNGLPQDPEELPKEKSEPSAEAAVEPETSEVQESATAAPEVQEEAEVKAEEAPADETTMQGEYFKTKWTAYQGLGYFQ